MAKEAEVVFKIASDPKGFLKGMADSKLATEKLLAGLGLIAGGSAILFGIGKSALQMGSDYEQAFAMTSTLMGKNQKFISETKNQVLELSANYGRMGTEGADAMYQLLSAGVKPDKALKALDASLKSATASGAGLTDVVDVGTTVLNAYGKKTEDLDSVLNMLMETQNLGKTTVQELAQNYGQLLPIASQMGVSFENVSAAMSVMTAQGIKTPQAITGLKALFTELGREGSTTADILKDKTGKSFNELVREGKPLNEIMDILKNSAEEQGKEFTNLFTSVEASGAASALSGKNSIKFAEAMKYLTDKTSDTDDAFKKNTETFKHNASVVKEKMNKALIDLYNVVAPKLVPAMKLLANNMKIIAPVLVALGISFGVASIAIGLFLIKALLIKGAMILASAGIKILNSALSFSAGPIGIAIAVIGLLVGALYALDKSSKESAKNLKLISDVNLDKELTKNAEATDKNAKKISKTFEDMRDKINVNLAKLQTDLASETIGNKFVQNVDKFTAEALSVLTKNTDKTISVISGAYTRIAGLSDSEGALITQNILTEGNRRKEVVQSASNQIKAIYESSKENNYKLTKEQGDRIISLEKVIASTTLETISSTKAKAIGLEALYNDQTANQTYENAKQLSDIKLKSAKEDFDNQVKVSGELLNSIEQQHEQGIISEEQYVSLRKGAIEELKTAQLEMAQVERDVAQMRLDASKSAKKANDEEIESIRSKIVTGEGLPPSVEKQNSKYREQIKELKGVNDEYDKNISKEGAKVGVADEMIKKLEGQTLSYKNVKDAINGASGATENFSILVGGNLTRAIANTKLDETMKTKLNEMSVVLDEGQGMAGVKGTELMTNYKNSLVGVNVQDSAYTKALEVAMGLAPGSIKSQEEGIKVMNSYISGIASIPMAPIGQHQGNVLSNNLVANGTAGAGSIVGAYAGMDWWGNGLTAGSNFGQGIQAGFVPFSTLLLNAGMKPGAVPNLPGFATGTNNYPGGFARINEKGGEIVKLPSGSQVIPHDLSKRMVDNGGGSQNSFGNIIINGVNNPDEIARQIAGKIDKALGGKIRGGVSYRGI